MKISELAAQTGVSVRSIRYYEQQGLISPERLDNGYRMYNPLAVDQVLTIQFYLQLGMSTEQIAGFLHCVMKNKEAFCSEVLPVYKQKLEEIDKQLTLLTQIKANLLERISAIQAERSAAEEAFQNDAKASKR